MLVSNSGEVSVGIVRSSTEAFISFSSWVDLRVRDSAVHFNVGTDFRRDLLSSEMSSITIFPGVPLARVELILI